MRLLIKNGRLINPYTRIDGRYDILIVGGKIARIGRLKATKGTNVLNVHGAVVAPGFVDIHTHLRDPGFEYKEDIASGTRAAARGGFTTVCCMPNTDPVNDNISVNEYIVKKAKRMGRVKLLTIGAISKGLQGRELADIGDLANSGVAAISDDGRCVMDASLMRNAADYALTFGLPIISHAEDENLSRGGMINEGRISTKTGLKGIPAMAEEAIIARDIMISELTGAHLHFAHVTTKKGLELIHTAKKKGISVSCEVTPHHITLTEEALVEYDTNLKVSPPLRTEADKNALIKGIAEGIVDAIATDHAPHSLIEKEVGFEKAASGVIGMETALPVCLELVRRGKIDLMRLVELFTAGPARALNLKLPRLMEGDRADITILDPNRKVTINVAKFASKARNCPFNGWRLYGQVLYTLVDGKIVYNYFQDK